MSHHLILFLDETIKLADLNQLIVQETKLHKKEVAYYFSYKRGLHAFPRLSFPGSTLLVMTSGRRQHPPSPTSAARSAHVCYLLWEGEQKASPLVHPAGWKECKAENSQPLAFVFQAMPCSRGYGCYCSQLSCPTSLPKMLTSLQSWLKGPSIHGIAFMVRGTAEMQVRSLFCRLCRLMGMAAPTEQGTLQPFTQGSVSQPLFLQIHWLGPSLTSKQRQKQQQQQQKFLISSGERFLDNKEEICVFAVVSLVRKVSTIAIITVDPFLALQVSLCFRK